jgi:hypothetical protein
MKTSKKDPSPLRDPSRQTSREKSFRVEMDEYFATSPGTTYEKLEHFPKFASRQVLSRYLALYEIFKVALPVHGSVVQCGVNHGGSLMWWAHLSSILEPVNLQRRIFGFDTFKGFPSVDKKDLGAGAKNPQARPGGYSGGEQSDLERCAELFDRNRLVSHIPKVALVPGDATRTIPAFLKRNPELVVSVLHLDFDLYAPTKAAIDGFFPRMPKGGVIVFDELNNAAWPGETIAVHESLQLSRLRIQRFPFEPHLSYCVLE